MRVWQTVQVQSPGGRICALWPSTADHKQTKVHASVCEDGHEKTSPCNGQDVRPDNSMQYCLHEVRG